MNLTKKKVSWPAEYEVIPVASLAEILAAAVVPQQVDEAEVLLQLRLMDYSKSIKAAISLGELPIRDATTWVPLPAYADTAHTVVNAKEFKSYLERTGSVVELVIEPSRKKIIWKPREQAIRLLALPKKLATLISEEAPDINDVEAFLDNDDDYGRHLEEFESAIDAAVRWGELPIRDPETYGIRDAKDIDNAVVSVEDLQKYLKRNNSLIELVVETASDLRPQAPLPEVVKWNGQTYQPGPPLTDEEVEAARLEVEAIQEAERRGQVETQDWSVVKPQRFSPYRTPLYKFMCSEWQKGRLRRPTPRDVLDAWSVSLPAEIAKVLPDGLDYYDSNGNTKFLNLKALKQAIDRMTTQTD